MSQHAPSITLPPIPTSPSPFPIPPVPYMVGFTKEEGRLLVNGLFGGPALTWDVAKEGLAKVFIGADHDKMMAVIQDENSELGWGMGDGERRGVIFAQDEVGVRSEREDVAQYHHFVSIPLCLCVCRLVQTVVCMCLSLSVCCTPSHMTILM